ncbi:unnamed protein product [Sphenostylis stenocarpa]|uniref:LCR-like protein n=1 Tax=Sphenostylis stenocarpa TaxID=92480 RepID=A0AA86SAF2_9FABA|nr:unnamed protein product [Sphenostylis stenocarpa]
MASKVMLAIICIAFVFAPGEATRSDGDPTLYCIPGDHGCPDVNACYDYCMTFPFRGGAVCRPNNLCCCKA